MRSIPLSDQLSRSSRPTITPSVRVPRQVKMGQFADKTASIRTGLGEEPTAWHENRFAGVEIAAWEREEGALVPLYNMFDYARCAPRSCPTEPSALAGGRAHGARRSSRDRGSRPTAASRANRSRPRLATDPPLTRAVPAVVGRPHPHPTPLRPGALDDGSPRARATRSGAARTRRRGCPRRRRGRRWAAAARAASGSTRSTTTTSRR